MASLCQNSTKDMDNLGLEEIAIFQLKGDSYAVWKDDSVRIGFSCFIIEPVKFDGLTLQLRTTRWASKAVVL